MESHNQTASIAQSGGIEFAFGTGDGSHSFTWNPPASTNPSENDHQTGLSNWKRRRVQVNIVKQGVALLQLGSDMIYDFSSTHVEAERKLADVTAEKDNLQRNLDIVKDKLRDTLGRYRAIVETLDETWGTPRRKSTTQTYKKINAEEKVKMAEAEMDNLRDQYQAERVNLVREREELQKELDVATNIEMRCRDEIAQLKKDAESLRNHHKDCRSLYNNLQSDLFNARQVSVEARAELNEVQKGLDDSHDKYAKLVVEMRLLEEKNAAQKKAEAEIKRLRDENYSLSSEFRSGTLEDELRKALEEEISN
ncbi:hypothetical protein LY78DRAFT_706928 [Colletotrichum sublineola]|nr:hypothetical protein LY78DRAFT_706928 [Colletotrichum sublineola]